MQAAPYLLRVTLVETWVESWDEFPFRLPISAGPNRVDRDGSNVRYIRLALFVAPAGGDGGAGPDRRVRS
jgi:hypothetical protein